MLIPDFYEILDLVDESMARPPLDYDLDLNCSGKMSSQSKDSGRNSSRASSRGNALQPVKQGLPVDNCDKSNYP